MTNVFQMRRFSAITYLLIGATLFVMARILIYSPENETLGQDQNLQRQMEYNEKIILLRNSTYVMQPREISDMVDKLDAEKLCFEMSRPTYYFLCPLRNDYMTTTIRRGANSGTAQVLLRFLRETPGAAFIDIGANIGSVTIPVMRSLPADRWTIIVEANRDNLRSLLLAIDRNRMGHSRWIMIQRAIWNVSDQEVGWMSWWNSSNGFLEYLNNMPGYNLAVGAPRKKEIVKTITFDSHILPVTQQIGVRHAILKIDIEGAECIAFKTASKLLRGVNIPYIFMEHYAYYGWQTNWDCIGEMYSMIAKLGYTPFVGGNDLALDDRSKLDPREFRKWKGFDNVIWRKNS